MKLNGIVSHDIRLKKINHAIQCNIRIKIAVSVYNVKNLAWSWWQATTTREEPRCRWFLQVSEIKSKQTWKLELCSTFSFDQRAENWNWNKWLPIRLGNIENSLTTLWTKISYAGRVYIRPETEKRHLPKINNVYVTHKKVNLTFEEVVCVHEIKWNWRENFDFGRWQGTCNFNWHARINRAYLSFR